MKRAKKNQSKPGDFLAALLRTAYLPKEIPPVVTTKHFSNFCNTNYSVLKSQQTNIVKTTTNYATFTAPRAKMGRRNLALVHPVAQLGISLLITQHRQKIKEIISKSGTSLYRTDEDLTRSKAFLGLDFYRGNILRAKAYSEYPFILHADISRFFYTAYTHSIPWAVIGKEKTKEWLIHNKTKLNAHWANDFDRALQSCQSRETFGIPVGPDTSRVIAEIFLAGIEADKALLPWLKDGNAFRLVDDFIIGFEREENAHKTLAALRSALWKFNLQLNEEKTLVSPSRLLFREKWKLEHSATRISDTNIRAQRYQIARLLDLTLHHCSETRNDTPALWTCQRLSKLKNVKNNFSLLLDAFFRLAREFPRCTAPVVEFLINNQQLCQSNPMKSRVIRWIRSMLSSHLPHGHDYEAAWCLVACGVLKIKVRKKDIATDSAIPNPIVFAIMGLLRQHGLLTVSLSTWRWRVEFKKNGIFTQNWLAFYEAVRRKWTTDKKLVAAVKANSILSKMLSAKVTFLEDQVFEATQISISRRVFVKSPAKKLRVRGFGDIVIGDIDYE